MLKFIKNLFTSKSKSHIANVSKPLLFNKDALWLFYKMGIIDGTFRDSKFDIDANFEKRYNTTFVKNK